MAKSQDIFSVTVSTPSAHPFASLGRLLLRMTTLAIVYFITGKVGLFLAMPPGYVTIIWPPSGIAIGALILYGARLWPGIFIGAFFLNGYIAGAYDPTLGPHILKLITAVAIATGSTLQAVVASRLAHHYLGRPLKLNKIRDIFFLFILCGLVSCLIAASIGVSALYLTNTVSISDLSSNWITWWTGDVLGVLVFLPLTLLAPGGIGKISWKGTQIDGLPSLAILAIIVPLGLTFYAWKISYEYSYQAQKNQFERLAQQSEDALNYRFNSYSELLVASASFFQHSPVMNRETWHAYISEFDLGNRFPGIHGIGYIKYVRANEVDNFLKRARAEFGPTYNIHPFTRNDDNYIIQYLEPEEINMTALGLNIAFEDTRLQAAQYSRDSGKPVLTKKILLVQDAEKSPGFLLLYPLYKQGEPLTDEQTRHNSLIGWVYEPFVAKYLFPNLTQDQGKHFNLSVYDDNKETPDNLIYSDIPPAQANGQFKISKQINMMQQHWLVVWSSTSAFEEETSNKNPAYFLLGGLIFTGLITLFLLLVMVRTPETLKWMAEERSYILPFIIFACVSALSFYLLQTLQNEERINIKNIVKEQANKLALVIESQLNIEVRTLQFIGKRWDASNGTSEFLWRLDSRNHLDTEPGLRTVEWIDSTYHVRWVEPKEENENVVGLNVLSNEENAQVLRGASERLGVTLSPPLDLIQGYRAIIAYYPVHRNHTFDGFIAGIFSVDDLFGRGTQSVIDEGLGVHITDNDKDLFTLSLPKNMADNDAQVEVPIKAYDKVWQLTITPSKNYATSKKTELPILLFDAGLLIAALLALIVRALLIGKLQAHNLAEANKLNNAIMSVAPYLIIAVDVDGKIIAFNKASEEALGYKASEVIGHETPILWHDPEEIVKATQSLNANFDLSIEPGHETFSAAVRKFGRTSNEWTFIRKDNTRFPVQLMLTALLDEKGSIGGYLGMAQDITERKTFEESLKQAKEKAEEATRAKSMFLASMSHEIRTPMNGIVGVSDMLAETLLDEKQKSYVKVIDSSARYLLTVINEILDYSKIEANLFTLEIKPFNLERTLEEQVNLLQPLAKEKSIYLKLQLENEFPALVAGDESHLRKVLINLIGNSIKFTDKGSISVVARLTSETDGFRLSVHVRDTGHGIPPEARQYMFQPFYQAISGATHTTPGTGLGLAICKKICSMAGGDIDYESEVNVGTTFRFSIKYGIVPDQTLPGTTVNPGNEATRFQFTPKHILIVEDVVTNQFVIENILKSIHCTCDVANNGAESLEMVKNKKYDAIFMDCYMPVMDGYKAAQAIRAQESGHQHTVIIALTANASQEDREKCLASGMNDFISKPFRKTDIIQTLNKWFGPAKT